MERHLFPRVRLGTAVCFEQSLEHAAIRMERRTIEPEQVSILGARASAALMG